MAFIEACLGTMLTGSIPLNLETRACPNKNGRM